jgi:hypothetical protein
MRCLTRRLQLAAAYVSREAARLCAGRDRDTFTIVPPAWRFGGS